MNTQKQQAIEQIEKLKEDIKKLEKIVNAPDKVTYDDVVEKIKPQYYVDLENSVVDYGEYISGGFPSIEIAEREAIRIKWINIAEYVNEGWKPDWNDSEQEKHCLEYNYATKEIEFDCCSYLDCDGSVYFKSQEAAQLALEILGEEEFKKMCGVNQ